MTPIFALEPADQSFIKTGAIQDRRKGDALKAFAYICLAVASMAAAGCATDRDASTAGPVNLRPAGPAQLGSGRYLYQFELRDARGKLETDKPFALSTQSKHGPGLPFVADAKKVYQGVTDARGRTPVIALPFRVKPGDWRLRERIGEGPFGEDFRMTGPMGDHPLAGMDYVVVECSIPPRHHEGTTNAQGFTAYIASRQPEQLFLYVGAGEDLDARTKEACEGKQAG